VERAVDNFVLAVVEWDRCRVSIHEMNGNGIRGMTWSWVLMTLSCWVLSVSAPLFLTSIFSWFLQKGQWARNASLGYLLPAFRWSNIQSWVCISLCLYPRTTWKRAPNPYCKHHETFRTFMILWFYDLAQEDEKLSSKFILATCISTCCSHDGTE